MVLVKILFVKIQIKKGDPIALVGNSGYPGCSTGAHLHFEVLRNGQFVNPMQVLVAPGSKQN